MLKYKSLVVYAMNMDRYIIELLGMDSYVKGRRYYSRYVDLNDVGKIKDGYYYKFSVESERTYRHYKVEFKIKGFEITDYKCNCEQFKSCHTCKHIAASIYKYKDEIEKKLVNPMTLSSLVLNSFKNTKSTNNIKEEMKLELELEFGDYVSYRLRVGLKKTYVLNTENKLRNFVDAYRNGGEYVFGKAFTYNRDKYYFNSVDSELFEFLTSSISSGNRYYNTDAMYLSNRELNALFDRLKSREFTINGVVIIKGIVDGMPT